MTKDKSKYTHLGVEKLTQRKTAILARMMDMPIYALVEEWAQREWVEQKQAGLVNDAMLHNGQKTPNRGEKTQIAI